MACPLRLTVAVMLLAVAFPGPALAADAATRPNIILLESDDHHPDVLGCMGSQVKTPHIDRLAARGALFRNTICPGLMCAPSRNALLTGLRPQTLGIYYRDIPQSGPLSDEQALRLIHGYHAAVSFMDGQLGRLLKALQETGLAKNTIVVLWGDHGWHLGDHGMWCKHTNYEQAARIPRRPAASGDAAGRPRRGGDAPHGVRDGAWRSRRRAAREASAAREEQHGKRL